MIALIFSSIISFLTIIAIAPYLIKILYAAGIVGLDLHKKNKPRLPAGGVVVAFGVLAGLLSYVGIQTFIYGAEHISIPLLAVISTILIVTFGGLLDDLNVKSKIIKTKDGKNIKVGFPQWVKPLLTLPAAIPLMVIAAGETTMSVPLIGSVSFGIFYPLVLIPIGVVGASNMVNLLGGFNGVEAGMGIVYCLSLGIYALLHGSIASVIFLVSTAALFAFLRYNWFPAKILPGDTLTYLLGSMVAAGVIIGNMEKIGVIVMMPFFIEAFLKLRSKFKATCIGKLRPDKTIEAPYEKKIYSLTHVVMNLGRFTETQITIILIFIQFCFAIIPFVVF